MCVLEWPSQSPGLDPVEILWQDLATAVHQHSPSNLTQLELLCKEEWQVDRVRIPLQATACQTWASCVCL